MKNTYVSEHLGKTAVPWLHYQTIERQKDAVIPIFNISDNSWPLTLI